MSQMCAITLTLFLLFEHGFVESQTCVERQSLQLAQEGIIPCSFEDGYFGLYWYDTTDLIKQPILFDQEGRKGGAGYPLGGYDLALGGSLLINNVTSHHERTSVVVLLKEVTSEHFGHEVVVTVVGGRKDMSSMQIKRSLVGRNAINCEEKVVIVIFREEKNDKKKKIMELVQKDFELKFENVQNDINPVKDILWQINQMSLMHSHLILGGGREYTCVMESAHRETKFEEVWKEFMDMFELEK